MVVWDNHAVLLLAAVALAAVAAEHTQVTTTKAQQGQQLQVKVMLALLVFLYQNAAVGVEVLEPLVQIKLVV